MPWPDSAQAYTRRTLESALEAGRRPATSFLTLLSFMSMRTIRFTIMPFYQSGTHVYFRPIRLWLLPILHGKASAVIIWFIYHRHYILHKIDMTRCRCRLEDDHEPAIRRHRRPKGTAAASTGERPLPPHGTFGGGGCWHRAIAMRSPIFAFRRYWPLRRPAGSSPSPWCLIGMPAPRCRSPASIPVDACFRMILIFAVPRRHYLRLTASRSSVMPLETSSSPSPAR